MSSIASIGTALPEYNYSQDDVLRLGGQWLKEQPKNVELFKRFVTSSKTQNRHFVVPPEKILSIGGLKERADLFEEFGPALGSASLQSALTEAKVNSGDLSTIVFTSCSCPSIPSIDALIVENLKLNRTINRIPMYQHGCAGGVAGLRLAAELSRTQGNIAVTSVELCSLVFQRGLPSGAQLVGAAIFADGAASAVVSPVDRGLVFRSSQSFLIPKTRHLMGYDIFDDGFHLRLDRDLPQALLEVAPERIKSFLADNNLTSEQIPYWLFHPGGTKILDFLEANLSLQAHQSSWARQVLSTVGNLSSATVLFVIKEFLESKIYKHQDKIMMVGVGPGLTLELILFEWID